jgi:primosomal protein N' (replication factor Y)
VRAARRERSHAEGAVTVIKRVFSVPPASRQTVLNGMRSTLFEDPTQTVANGARFAEIVFDRPLDHAYSYAVPEHLRDLLVIGKRVLAPFGRGDRRTVGFCVGLSDNPPGREVKLLAQVLDEEPLLTPRLLQLTRWMADYYLCGWGQVLNAVLPSGVKRRSGTRSAVFVEKVPQFLWPNPVPKLSAKQKRVLEVLLEQSQPIEVRYLARLAQCGMGPIQGLFDKNLARRRTGRIENPLTAEADDDPGVPSNFVPETPFTLTEDQRQVWAAIEPALRDSGFKPFLLRGVTGSGKTEIYLRAIEDIVRQGKEALVLVPEISLTPQTIQAFRGRCGDVAVLHSHLQQAERGGHWRKIAAGKVQVIVGARSAVFAPARRLGLIVIDEEHEGSFKQDNTPRYHARDVAVMRARLENIPIILGSATPSLESWHNARRGQYTLLTLPKRVEDRPLPQVHLIDLRYDRQADKRVHGLSPSLERAMKHALDTGGQVILLLNRRGFSTYILCPACGRVEQCKFCDLALTFHKERHVLLCHYCGYEAPPPDRCPVCGQGQVRYQGMGTEKLEAEIQGKFRDKVVRRMDSDTMRRPGSHRRTLEAFQRGEINILLGTQMIAKGLDFPNVTLVGVVNADISLHFADFRSAERTFQLLAQVAGRTGRGPRGGKVFVQTYSPQHPSIAQAAHHDYLGFAQAELSQRQKHGYPPFQRMARIIIRGRDTKKAGDFADRLAAGFEQAHERMKQADNSIRVRILGPAEAPIFRLKGYHRFHFQLQSPSSAQLHDVLRQALPTVRPPHGIDVAIDIDPQDML